MIKVFRLENKMGLGPCHSLFSLKLGDAKRKLWIQKINSMPNPKQEFGLPNEVFQNFVCGCISEEQLKSWFGDFLQELFDSGFEIKTFFVEESNILVGEYQVMFIKEKN